jgi:RNA polymerase sigma-70 factor (ECF subfamily)
VSTDWSDVYRQTFPDLVRFLHRKVWDPVRARDLAQVAFARALWHQPRRPRPTVLRRKRHLALLKSEAPQPEAPDPAAELARRERWDRVKEALEALGPRDREALLLWDAGLSYNEIARQTGLAVGAVGTTLARARRRLVEAHRERESNDVARG